MECASDARGRQRLRESPRGDLHRVQGPASRRPAAAPEVGAALNSVTLRKHEDRRIAAGHLWAFSNEIRDVTGAPQPGDIVQLRTHAGALLGTGFYNPNSLIAVRLLSRTAEEISFEFFRKRIAAALELRERLYPGQTSYRLLHGEGDGLPGLVVDRYNEYLSVQTTSFGMDRRLTLICDVLESLLHPAGIVERNESAMRDLEGLEARTGVLRGSAGRPVISEHGIDYAVDLLEGQKTGFFFDQRENRQAVRRYAAGSSVLDCFCNDGAFALNAAAGGAQDVTGVDGSASAVKRARANAAANALQACARFVAADALSHLRDCAGKGKTFNLVILDPPSFTKSKRTVTNARRGYLDLHHAALRVLVRGGFLATASCSHHITAETFLGIVNRSAAETGRTAQLLDWRGAAPDHPTLPAMPETHYLKFGIFRME